MTRRQREPGVRVICSDARHQDTKEFAQRGFHLLHHMELLPMENGDYTLNLKDLSSAMIAPVKNVLHPFREYTDDQGRHVHESQRTYVFECSCGQNVQRLERPLVDDVLARVAAAGEPDPLTARVDLDIITI